MFDRVDWWNDCGVDTFVLAVTGTSSDEGSWYSIDVAGVKIFAFIVKVQSSEDIDWIANKDLSPDGGSV